VGFPQSIGTADTPLKVAELLDCFAQNRFAQPEGRLGVSRLVTLNGHNRVRLYPETAFEKELMGRVQAAGRPYVVSFLHVARPPAISKQTARNYPQYTASTRAVATPFLLPLGMELMVPLPASPRSRPNVEEDRAQSSAMHRRMEKLGRDLKSMTVRVTAEASRLKRGQSLNLVCNDWQVAARPVRAKADCLSCHQKSKAGDTLGVMVYAVNRRAGPLEVVERTAAGRYARK
jgi:hypothetical protein